LSDLPRPRAVRPVSCSASLLCLLQLSSAGVGQNTIHLSRPHGLVWEHTCAGWQQPRGLLRTCVVAWPVALCVGRRVPVPVLATCVVRLCTDPLAPASSTRHTQHNTYLPGSCRGGDGFSGDVSENVTAAAAVGAACTPEGRHCCVLVCVSCSVLMQLVVLQLMNTQPG
jgi:hypothetical protein